MSTVGGARAPLYTETTGNGADVVLVHGWGLHGGVWEDVAAALSARYRVTVVDLPGHGRSPLRSAFTLESVLAALLAVAPPRAVWVGWSLGGLFSLALAARHADRVTALVPVAATPRFVQGPDWPWGLAPEVLGQFAADLEADFDGTLRRFLSLQTRGSHDGAATLRRLRRVLAQWPPSREALRGGLEVLRSVDLRTELAAVQCSALWLFGERDTLVPDGVAQFVAGAMPNADTEVIAGAGHAPFLVDPAGFAGHVERYLGEVA